MAQKNFVAWTYTADDGTTYTRRADDRMTAQNGLTGTTGNVGGTAATGSTIGREMPRNLKPRQALVVETGTGFAARVTIYTPAALAALVIGTTTLDVFDGQGNSHTCVVQGRQSEPLKGIIRP